MCVTSVFCMFVGGSGRGVIFFSRRFGSFFSHVLLLWYVCIISWLEDPDGFPGEELCMCLVCVCVVPVAVSITCLCRLEYTGSKLL